MSNVAANAIAGKPAVQGGVFCAPLGTTLPTDETGSWPSGFMPVGYLTDQGVTRGKKVDSEVKKAWGGDPLIVIDKGKERTAKLGLAEYLSQVVQEILHGKNNVTVTPPTTSAGRKIKVKDTDDELDHMIWGFQLFSGSAVGRIIFPDCQLKEFDDWTYKDEDIAARGITLLQFPDAAGGYAYEYWDDGRKVLTP